MFSMLGHALLGLLIGFLAVRFMPGEWHHGIILTALLGMAGGWLGGRIGKWLGMYQEGHIMGFVLSVAGAMIILFVSRLIFH
jgi:uncharacterized membrane protein YeaQ/YmgE (transglycosylase-associated protein family)